MYRVAYSELSLYDRLMLNYKWCLDSDGGRYPKLYGKDTVRPFYDSLNYFGKYWVLFYDNEPKDMFWLEYEVMKPINNSREYEVEVIELLGWNKIITEEIELPVEKRIMYIKVGLMGARIDGVVYSCGDYWLDLGDLEKVKLSGNLTYKFIDTYMIENTESIIKNKVISRVVMEG